MRYLIPFMLIAFCLQGCVAPTGAKQEEQGANKCLESDLLRFEVTRFESRESLASTVMEEAARLLLSGQCSDLSAIGEAADQRYKVDCSSERCLVEERAK